MSRAKAKAKEGKLWNRAKWRGFVNVRLSESEKKHVKGNLLAEENGYEFLMNAATDGYKCSISYSIPEDVYTVSLTGVYQEKANAGITMSMRHRDLIVALTALAFCADLTGKSQEWSDRYSLVGDDDW